MSGATSRIFSFIILIVVCLKWLILINEKSYTTMSTLSSFKVDVLGGFFLLCFLLVPHVGNMSLPWEESTDRKEPTIENKEYLTSRG